ncbi:MAG: ComF family protein [candidate division KSB1 bacterium]|nr:ComF family protein [candidate division KSB1 bacterium]MDZ7303763.1 ComF family protein [candidate division KSB1 bacterium]MDZ7313022.1 ComF family protein [candidate division KSB1 bacterium]
MTWLDRLARLANELAGLIYPPKCLICDGPQTSSRTPLLCENCLAEMAARPLPGVITVEALNSSCGQSVEVVFAGWHYDTAMQHVIHAMKYRRRPSLSKVLGRLLAQRLQITLGDKISDAVLVPVPLHRRRERERGFNQSLLLAKVLAKSWNIRVWPRFLRRTRFTQSQATLGAEARWKNVEGAFALSSRVHPGAQRIFLIDDVFTTGATMNACAYVLKSAGVTSVMGIALAKAGMDT